MTVSRDHGENVVVHWCALHPRPGLLDAAWAVLSPDERQRALRLRTGDVRSAFVMRRAALRRLLAGQLDIDPRDVRFVRPTNGRPRLAWPQGQGLSFSVAQRGLWALVAIGTTVDVGVDVERIVTLPFRRLGLHVFSANERERIAAAPDQKTAFFETWTRFEARLKLDEIGLAAAIERGLQGIADAAYDPNDARDASAAVDVRNIPAPEGHVAALATRGAPPG